MFELDSDVIYVMWFVTSFTVLLFIIKYGFERWQTKQLERYLRHLKRERLKREGAGKRK
tara:strand:- start:428 stop:604 length:177 start_codon:yes stop_codon:yes gene_type:complete